MINLFLGMAIFISSSLPHDSYFERAVQGEVSEAFAELKRLNLPESFAENPREDPSYIDVPKELDRLFLRFGHHLFYAIETGFEDPFRWNISLTQYLSIHILPRFDDRSLSLFIKLLQQDLDGQDMYHGIFSDMSLYDLRRRFPDYSCKLSKIIHERSDLKLGRSLVTLSGGCPGAAEMIIAAWQRRDIETVTLARMILNMKPFPESETILKVLPRADGLLKKTIAEGLLWSDSRTLWMANAVVREILLEDLSNEPSGVYWAYMALLFSNNEVPPLAQFGKVLGPLEQLNYVATLFQRVIPSTSFQDREEFIFEELKSLYVHWEQSLVSLRIFEKDRSKWYQELDSIAKALTRSEKIRQWFYSTISERHPVRALSYLILSVYSADYAYPFFKFDEPILRIAISALEEPDAEMRESALRSISGVLSSYRLKKDFSDILNPHLIALFSAPEADRHVSKLIVLNSLPLDDRFFKAFRVALLQKEKYFRNTAFEKLRVERRYRGEDFDDFYSRLKESITMLSLDSNIQDPDLLKLFADIDMDEIQRNSRNQEMLRWSPVEIVPPGY